MEPAELDSKVCGDYRADLNLLASGALSVEDARRAREHLQTCAACKEYYETQREVSELARKESEAVPPLDTEKVLVRVKERMASAQSTPHAARDAEGKAGGGNWMGTGVGAGLGFLAIIALIFIFVPFRDTPKSSAHDPKNITVPGNPTHTTNPPETPGMQGVTMSIQVSYDNLGLPQLGTVLMKNSGAQNAAVASFHPLAAHYELEIRRPSQANSEFQRLNPRALRKSSPGVGFESVEAGTTPVKLGPGDIYALEFDLRAIIKEPGEYRITAHYLGFDASSTDPNKSTLHSSELKFELPVTKSP
jgi:hypothetical protein